MILIGNFHKATEYLQEALAKYSKVFNELGVITIKGLNIEERNDSFNNYNINLIKDASLIFLLEGISLGLLQLSRRELQLMRGSLKRCH